MPEAFGSSEVLNLGGVKVRPPTSAQARLLNKEPSDAGDEPQQTPRVKQIPDALWNSEEDKIRRFLLDEIYTAESERWDFFMRVARWKRAYFAPLSSEPKHFPLHHSSNLTMPVIMEQVNTMTAHVIQATLKNKPRWVFEDLADEWEPFVDELEKFLDIASRRDLRLKKAGTSWIVEGVKIGTSVLEISYDVDERKVFKYTPDGRRVYPSRVVAHDGPRAKRIPLERFWIRMRDKDLQKARWVAVEHSMTLEELRVGEVEGRFFGIEDLLSYYADPTLDLEKASDEIRKTEEAKPPRPEEYRIFRVYFRWDIDDDGEYEELLAYFHPETGAFIGREFYTRWSGRRPFVKWGFFPVEDRFYDMGLAEMLEQIQEEISTLHNQRIDGASMAILKMIIKRKMVKSLQPGDPLYMGKIIEANDIWNDLREFRLSDPPPSSYQEEIISRGTGERLSGLNEAAMGSAMPVTRTTAFAQAALLEQQSKRIGMVIDAVNDAIAEIGQHTLDLYHQHGTNGKALLWLGERGRVVEAIFSMRRRIAELGDAITTSPPSNLLNMQTRRENAIAQFNLLMSLYRELLGLVQALAPQAVGEVAHAIIKAGRKFLGDVMETFDTSDPEEILASLSVVERVLPSMEDLGGLESFERAAATDQILAQLARLEGTLREAEASRDFRDRELSSLRTRANGNGSPEGVLGRRQSGAVPTPGTTLR